MYENLVAFLLGKKSELSNEDMREFMELLCKAMNVTEEYHALEKQSIIENIIDSVDVKDRIEREVISDAIDNILMFDESSEQEILDDLFEDKSENTEPLKSRKLKRGRFSKSKENLKIEQKINDPSKITPKNEEINTIVKIQDEKKIDPSQIFMKEEDEFESFANNDDLPEFEFDVSEFQDNHFNGPDFEFDLNKN